MADIVALPEREKAKMSKERLFSRRPPYPIILLNKLYPERDELPTFAQYDRRKGNANEHMSKFMDTVRPYARDEDPCLCEFLKSLSDHAYTWYTSFRLGFILTWDDMVDVFCSKYFHGKETVALESFKVQSKGMENTTWSLLRDSKTYHLTTMIILRKRH